MSNKLNKLLLILCSSIIFTTSAIKIDRVILSTNDNPTYIEFWPIVAKVWKEYIGIKPTLALIADKSVIIDETLGDVIRFEPIPGIPSGLQAQCIRLILPAYFEDEVCITSDIDMIPLNKKYFLDSVKSLGDDNFIIYKNRYYERNKHTGLFPMCYNVSKGKNFKEIFEIKNVKDIKEVESIIINWHSLNWGWQTDERMLYKYVTNWKHYEEKCIKLNHYDDRRIDRGLWAYDPNGVKPGSYVDAHCLRPYSQYKKEIDDLVNALTK